MRIFKSSRFKSGNFGGLYWWSPQPTYLLLNFSLKIRLTLVQKWTNAPSCINHAFYDVFKFSSSWRAINSSFKNLAYISPVLRSKKCDSINLLFNISSHIFYQKLLLKISIYYRMRNCHLCIKYPFSCESGFIRK